MIILSTYSHILDNRQLCPAAKISYYILNIRSRKKIDGLLILSIWGSLSVLDSIYTM